MRAAGVARDCWQPAGRRGRFDSKKKVKINLPYRSGRVESVPGGKAARKTHSNPCLPPSLLRVLVFFYVREDGSGPQTHRTFGPIIEAPPQILHLLSQFTLQVGMKWLPLQNINCPCEEARERLEQPRCACALCGEDCGVEGKLELRVNKFDFPPTHPLGGGNARSNRRDAGSDCAPTRCATRRQPQPLQHVCVCVRARWITRKG